LIKSIIIAILFLGTLPSWAQSGFTEISKSVGIEHSYVTGKLLMGGGAAFFDFDNDGDLDIYMTGGPGRDVLYRNDGNDSFTEIGEQAGFLDTGSGWTMGVVTGDIDNDGYRDVFVTGGRIPNLLFKNNRDGTFTNISESAGIVDTSFSISASFGDFNLDGYLDIYVVNHVNKPRITIDEATGQPNGFAHECFPDFFYLNNGDNTFTEMSAQLGLDGGEGCGLAVVVTDFDNDGDMDIYIANDFGEWVHPNVLYRNDDPANLTFSDVSEQSGLDAAIYGMGVAVGDYDRDGDLDYYTTNLGRNVLYNNLGNGFFMDVTDFAGVANGKINNLFATSWGTAFFDYDNDGLLDLFVTNGFIDAIDIIKTTPYDPNQLYKNNGDGTFTDVSSAAGVADGNIGRGFACADFDDDGDIDLLVMVIEEDSSDAHILLYRNDLPNGGNHYLKIEVQGTVNNRDGYGTHIRIVVGGESWISEIDGGSSHLSHNSSIAHFGLGRNTIVDSLFVIWPGGATQVFTDIPVDRKIGITEGSSLVTNVESNQARQIENFQLYQNYPNPFNPQTTLVYDLLENCHVTLKIYDLLGHEVRTLVDDFQALGQKSVTWNGRNNFGETVSSGLYFYKLQIADRVEGRRMLLLK